MPDRVIPHSDVCDFSHGFGLFGVVFIVAITAYLSPILFYWIFHPMRGKGMSKRDDGFLGAF